MSSLYQNVSEIVTEITMSWDGIPWLAVEGENDERLLRSRNFGTEIKIVVGYGWEGVRDILVEAMESKCQNVLMGLIDRDYRDHAGKQLDLPNLVLTDFRDIENMLFWSPSFFRVYSEFGSMSKMPRIVKQEINFEEIRTGIKEVCERLGKFRIYCQCNELEISFKKIDYKKFVSDKNLQIDVRKLLQHLNGKNIGRCVLTPEDWETSQHISWLDSELRQPWRICNGHDLMAIVGISFKRKWGTKNIQKEEVETAFRIGYSDVDLSGTKMWGKLMGIINSFPQENSMTAH